jgi:hypothetical protein
MQNALWLLWHKIVSVTKHPNLHLIQVRDDDSMAAEEREKQARKGNAQHKIKWSSYLLLH